MALDNATGATSKRSEVLREDGCLDVITRDIVAPIHPSATEIKLRQNRNHSILSTMEFAIAICAGAYDADLGVETSDTSHIAAEVLSLPISPWQGVACTLVWFESVIVRSAPDEISREMLSSAIDALALVICTKWYDHALPDKYLSKTADLQESDLLLHACIHTMTAFYTGLGHCSLLLQLLDMPVSTTPEPCSIAVNTSTVLAVARNMLQHCSSEQFISFPSSPHMDCVYKLLRRVLAVSREARIL